MRNNYITMLILSFIFMVFLFLSVSFPVNSEDNNLIINGDFENPTLTGWGKEFWNEGWSIQTTDQKVYNGNYSLKIYSGTVENDVRLVQRVPVEPNTYYRLSGFIATENVQGGNIGANISIMSGFAFAGKVRGTTEWKHYELNLKTGKTHDLLKACVRLGMFYNTAKGTAYFDDIRLVKLDYIPKYYTILEDPKKSDPQDERSGKDKITENKKEKKDQTKKIKKRDPVFSRLNLSLILLLVSIGLVPVALNIIITIFREKKNVYTQ